MSVLIKGIKMPTGNDKLQLIIHSNGQVIISHKTYYEEAEAVSVTPHGRLIDADALDDGFTNLRWENGDCKSGALTHWGDRPHWCLTGSEIENLINAAPTIIEAEEENE